MDIVKGLVKDAKKKNICKPRFKELVTLDDGNIPAMAMMYFRDIDFCLANNFPSNDFIRANFKGRMETFGIFLDENINLTNYRRCVALGKTTGKIAVSCYSVSEIYVKHESVLFITASENAVVRVDCFDDCVIHIIANDRANVRVNRYGGKVTTAVNGENAVIKVIEKNKNTY